MPSCRNVRCESWATDKRALVVQVNPVRRGSCRHWNGTRGRLYPFATVILVPEMDHRRLVVVFTFLVIFTFDLARTTDIDFWWHLKTGELIFQTGSVPRVDA